jgi:hypothetical protein
MAKDASGATKWQNRKRVGSERRREKAGLVRGRGRSGYALPGREGSEGLEGSEDEKARDRNSVAAATAQPEPAAKKRTMGIRAAWRPQRRRAGLLRGRRRLGEALRAVREGEGGAQREEEDDWSW